MAYPVDFNPAGLTLKQLAEKHGVSVRTISNWKREWNQLTDDTLVPLAGTVDLVVDTQLETPENVTYKHVISPQFVNIVRVEGGNVDTVVILSPQDQYQAAVDAIQNNQSLEQFFVRQKIKLVPIKTNNSVVIDEDGVKFRDVVIAGKLADVITSMYLDGRLDADSSLVWFLDNLIQNPDSHVLEQLYPFLLHNDIDISEGGHLIAYKKVRPDYYDIHSQTIRNMPGDAPEMPRVMVQNDPSKTCAAGLHVCAKSYLNQFGYTTDRVVLVKVNPRDVVSVPYDYNGAKMRVCKYEVLSDYE